MHESHPLIIFAVSRGNELRKLLGLLIVLGFDCMFFLAPSNAQVLVYKMEISEDSGINYHAYNGGYFVAPILGGVGSFLLCSDDGPRLYVEAAESGRLFSAVRAEDDKMTVMSASTRSDTASGAMLAYGKADYAFQITTPTAELKVRIAKQLNGTSLNSDDESALNELSSDGSLGMAGISRLKLRLDEEETWAANKDGKTIPQTLAQLKLTLERSGYGNADEEMNPEEPDDSMEKANVGADASLLDVTED